MVNFMPSFYNLSGSQVRYSDDVSTLLGLKRISERRLFFYGVVMGLDEYAVTVPDAAHLALTDVTRIILEINAEDDRAEKAFLEENPGGKFERKPILLFIDSQGGDSGEGFALVDVIELSKTPIWTINLGEWSSMGFLIGITGHRRFSLSRATFLWHDGGTGFVGSTGKVQDAADFNKLYENEVVKKHVLAHSDPEKFTEAFYDANVRKEFYMLPEQALSFGFIDEILTDLSVLSTS